LILYSGGVMSYADPAKARECQRRYRAANRETVNERNRKRYAANPERARERGRANTQRYRKAHRDTLRIRDRQRYAGDPPRALLSLARKRAKSYGVPCTLTLMDVRALHAPMRCSATGLPLAHATSRPRALSPSLDRIVPALGYVPGNVRLVCHAFNLRRRNDPVSQDFRHALRVLAETSHTSDKGFIR